MDAAKQRAIASAGGRAAHRSGHAHEFDTAEAREAGRRGGLARSAKWKRSIELADGQGVMRVQDRNPAPGDTPSSTEGRHSVAQADAAFLQIPTSTPELIANPPKLSV
ncbi:MAG TPA: general stress protein [Lysobacter sp.]|nr:general stress protein [Lysobacter sp.]